MKVRNLYYLSIQHMVFSGMNQKDSKLRLLRLWRNMLDNHYVFLFFIHRKFLFHGGGVFNYYWGVLLDYHKHMRMHQMSNGLPI